MAEAPTRRRSFLSLPIALRDGARELTTHRSFPGPILRSAADRINSNSASNSTSNITSNSTPAARGSQPSTLQPQARTLTAKRALAVAALVLVSYSVGSRSCVRSSRGSCTAACKENNNSNNNSNTNGAASSPTLNFHRTNTVGNVGSMNASAGGGGGRSGSGSGLGLTGRSGRPPDERPYYDLVIAVLAVGGDSEIAQDEIARVRKVYARYGGEVVPAGAGDGSATAAAPLTIRVVFVVGRAGLPDGVELPGTGLLLGDFYHVDVREGYRHLSDKTKAMTGLADHLRFRFLAKTDGDTIPCLSRVTQQLTEVPPERQPRVYAGLLNRCGKVFPAGHKLHDPEFLAATGGTIDCHPMYHQGAFYILGEDIVAHLNRSRDMLAVMSVEDAMMGLWLLGVDKVLLDIGGSFYCKCFTNPVPQNKMSFYHFCKTDEKMDVCLNKLGAC